jgi:DNA-binding MarR family transcriptional regulator
MNSAANHPVDILDRPTIEPDRTDNWLGFLLSQSASLVSRRTAQALCTLELNPRSLGFLLELRAMHSASQLEVAKRLRMDRTTSSQLVDALVSAGLVWRGIDERDRRQNLLRLSTDGQAVLRVATAEAAAAEAAIMKDLSAAERATLKLLLRKLLGLAT